MCGGVRRGSNRRRSYASAEANVVTCEDDKAESGVRSPSNPRPRAPSIGRLYAVSPFAASRLRRLFISRPWLSLLCFRPDIPTNPPADRCPNRLALLRQSIRAAASNRASLRQCTPCAVVQRLRQTHKVSSPGFTTRQPGEDAPATIESVVRARSIHAPTPHPTAVAFSRTQSSRIGDPFPGHLPHARRNQAATGRTEHDSSLKGGLVRQPAPDSISGLTTVNCRDGSCSFIAAWRTIWARPAPPVAPTRVPASRQRQSPARAARVLLCGPPSRPGSKSPGDLARRST